MTIVVTGGSGFVGTRLTHELITKGHVVIVIDKRSPSFTHKNLFFIPCDLAVNTLPFNVLERTDAIVNLVGSPIGRKWTPRVKENIRATRINATKNLIESLAQTVNKPSIFVSASGTGYYGEGGNELLDERAPQGTTFLATLTGEWEAQAMRAEEFGCRVVIVRTAPILGKYGFLAPLWKSARFHLSGTIFKKDFWMPWIHIDDAVSVYLFALETNTLQGVVNAAAPTHTRYSELARIFRKVTRSFSLGRLPLATLRFGEMIDGLSTNEKIVPQRLIDKGFSFAFVDIEDALRSIKKESDEKSR